jgi:hypothetical protein
MQDALEQGVGRNVIGERLVGKDEAVTQDVRRELGDVLGDAPTRRTAYSISSGST